MFVQVSETIPYSSSKGFDVLLDIVSTDTHNLPHIAAQGASSVEKTAVAPTYHTAL